MEQLPRDIIREIASNLDYSAIYNLTLVSKQFKFIIHDKLFWIKLASHYPQKYYIPSYDKYRGMQYMNNNDLRTGCLKYFMMTTNTYIPGSQKILSVNNSYKRIMKSRNPALIKHFLTQTGDEDIRYILTNIYYKALKSENNDIIRLVKEYLKSQNVLLGYKNHKMLQSLKIAARKGDFNQIQNLFHTLYSVDFDYNSFDELFDACNEILRKSVKYGNCEYTKFIYSEICQNAEKWKSIENDESIHKCVCSLRGDGGYPDRCRCFLESHMHLAVLNENREILDFLLSEHCQPGLTLDGVLEAAIMINNVALYDYIESKGVGALNAAASAAVQCGNSKLVAKMFDGGNLYPDAYSYLIELINIAIKYNKIQMVQQLVNLARKSFIHTNILFNAVIKTAVEYGLVEILKYLIEVASQEYKYISLSNFNNEIARGLDSDFNPNDRDFLGHVPQVDYLLKIANPNDSELVDYLLECK